MTAGPAPWMSLVLIALIVAFGATALAFFYFSGGKPSGGVSKLNIRAVGIVFVVVAAAVLAVVYESAVVAAVGLLGAVAGYLFGASAVESNESQANVGDISGDNAKVAGRDLVEKLESLSTVIDKYEATVGGAEAGSLHGHHIHEERIMRIGGWSTSVEPTSEIVRAHERALRDFPSPDFRLITVSTTGASDFIHVVFVFEARSYDPGTTASSLRSEGLGPPEERATSRGIGR